MWFVAVMALHPPARAHALAPSRSLPALALAASLVALSPEGAGSDILYHFTDEHGVPHFSNQPLDPRYRPIQPSSPSLLDEVKSSAVRGTEDSPEVSVVAPAEAVLGDVFDITVYIATSTASTGWVELSFDPDTLELDGLSVAGDALEPGNVRLEVHSDGKGACLGTMSVHVIAQQPTDVSVELRRLDLRDENDEPINAQATAFATVRLVSPGAGAVQNR